MQAKNATNAAIFEKATKAMKAAMDTASFERAMKAMKAAPDAASFEKAAKAAIVDSRQRTAEAEARAAERVARAEAALRQANDRVEAMAVRRPAAPACPVCFENYHASEVVPRILACGHTICERCLQTMLARIVADGNTKAIDCPKCRKEMHVPRGSATELPIVFDLL